MKFLKSCHRRDHTWRGQAMEIQNLTASPSIRTRPAAQAPSENWARRIRKRPREFGAAEAGNGRCSGCGSPFIDRSKSQKLVKKMLYPTDFKNFLTPS
jgi:hypothetical protein